MNLPAALERTFVGPIFLKEVRVSGRRWSTSITRGGYALLLLCVVALVFGVFAANFFSRSQDAFAANQSLQAVAPIITAAVGWFQLALLSLVGPSMTSGSICDERRAGTLSTLLTTPLSALEIIVGKLAGSTVQLVILCLVATPILLAIRIFGGVPAQFIVQTMSIGLAVGISGAAIGLLTSTVCKRSVAASFMALVLMGALHVGVMVVVAAIFTGFRGPPPPWMASLCAPMAYVLIQAEAMGAPVFASQSWVGVLTVGYSGAITVAATLIAAALLRRLMRREAAGAPAARPRPATATLSMADLLRRLIRRPLRHSRTVWDAPVLWRELQQPLFKSMRWLIAASAGAAGMLLWILLGAGVNDETTVAAPVIAIGLLLFGQACIMNSGAVASEREGRSWETLLTTTLTPAQIVMGKFWGGVRRCWFLPAVLGAYLFLLALLGSPNQPLHVAVLLPLVTLGPLLLLNATGVCFSLRTRKASRAASWNLLFALGLYAAFPLVLALVWSVLFRNDPPHALLVPFFTSHPAAMTISILEVALDHHDLTFEIGARNSVGLVSFLLIAFVWLAIYVGATAVVLRTAAKRVRAAIR